MRKVVIECLYCGYQCLLEFLFPVEEGDHHDFAICSKCQSTHVRMRRPESKIDYYAGAPEFPEDSCND